MPRRKTRMLPVAKYTAEIKITEQVKEDFSKKVDKTTDCHIWKGSINAEGYGVMIINGKSFLAHRISYTIFNGSCSCKCVLHKCDNPKCVNPDHLFAGTHADNIYDMVSKNRHVKHRGASSNRNKLIESQVLEIRATKNKTYTQMAREYHVSVTVISWIMNGKSWKYLLNQSATQALKEKE